MRCYSGSPPPSNAVPRYQNFQNFPFTKRLMAPLIAQLVKNLPAMQETGFDSWVGKISWRRDRPPTPVFLPGESQWTEVPGRLQSKGYQ